MNKDNECLELLTKLNVSQEKAPPRAALNLTVKLSHPSLLTMCSCDVLRYLLPLATLRVIKIYLIN